MIEASVTARRADGVLTLALDREERLNAIDRATVGALCEHMVAAAADDEVHAVVLYGHGRGFSSGGDLRDVLAASEGLDPGPRLEMMRAFQRLVTTIWELPLPVIAAVHGPVYGAAFNVVLACDLVVAADDAVFCQVFARRGVAPDLGGAYLLPRAVGMQRAKQLMFFSQEVTAVEAADLGFVNEVAASREDAIDRARAMATWLADTPRVTVDMTKRLANRSVDLGLTDSLQLEALGQSLMLGAPHIREVIDTFLDGPAITAASDSRGAIP